MSSPGSTRKLPSWRTNGFAWAAMMFLWFALWNAPTARAFPFVGPVFLLGALAFVFLGIRHHRHDPTSTHRSQDAHR